MSQRKRKLITVIAQPPATAHFRWRARLAFYFYGNGNGFTFSVRHRELYFLQDIIVRKFVRHLCILSKGHNMKVYTIKGGGLKNLSGFRPIGFSLYGLFCIQLNLIRRKPGKFLSPPRLIESKLS